MNDNLNWFQRNALLFYWAIFIIILIFIVFAWVNINSLLNYVYPSLIFDNYSSPFFALNTLFSGLAFAVLIFTLLLQIRNLKIQQKKIFEQKNELDESIKRQEKIIEEMSKQSTQLEFQRIQMELTTKLNAYNNLVSHLFYISSNFKKSDVSNLENNPLIEAAFFINRTHELLEEIDSEYMKSKSDKIEEIRKDFNINYPYY
jgi:uncharacterized membrane protein YgaE (UPF0421/DUF939 family)